MQNETRNLIEQVLSSVSQNGAEGDVLITEEAQLGLKCHQGELSEYKVTSSRTVGVRVICGDQVGTSYSESTEAADLQNMVEAALANAKYSKQSPTEKITSVPQDILDWSDEIYRPDNTPQKDKIALALSLEAGLQARDSSASAPYNGFGEAEVSVAFGNTHGHRCVHQERYFSCYNYALLQRDDKQSMHLGYQVGRTFDELSAEACIAEAYDTAFDLLDGAPVETGRYDVIFAPETLSELFGPFGMCWSGLSAMKEINPLRTQVGELIAHPEFSLSESPYVKGGFAIKAFDGEGFGCVDTKIVSAGYLQTLLHNGSTAKHFGVPNTFNASRGPKSSLGVSPGHMSIAAGSTTEAETEGGTYLEILSLQGLHSGANAVSGQFSFGASGFLCRDGVRIQPVRGITVAGNFYAMLKEIEAIADTVHANHGHTFFAPKIRFSGLSVAGN